MIRAALALSVLMACAGESAPPAPPAPAPSSPAPAPPAPAPRVAAAIAHGGVGSAPEKSDGCRRAVDAALAALARGADPVDAAVAGVVVLEDDPRFNAGTGSRVRLDGETVQMDAAVMSSSGRFAAVAAIEHLRNPVLVARAVMDTPHLLLAGDGATRFARSLGMPAYDPATDDMRRATEAIKDKLRRLDPSLPADWTRFDWRSRWNFERTLEQAGLAPSEVGHDTVGVAVRTADGRFAVALSTGGTAITLRGRVGDVPILGAGLYAGPHGAAAATGSGERIVEAGLARQVHGWLADGVSAEEAARRAVAAIPEAADLGIIVISPDAVGVAADRPMAWAAREAGGTRWLGP
jgi:isoaspartyl peptidase/L-asparaginase-like protein (Ntn-hydrolase superfamily)